MRSPYGFYNNGIYKVCLTGTVWVYDQAEHLIGKFNETPYTYYGAFVPNTHFFITRTNENHLVLYDLKHMQMVKKIKTCNTGTSEDAGFCFSPDGKTFFCIQSHWKDPLKRQIVTYQMPDLVPEEIYFKEEKRMFLHYIEMDEDEICYVLGYDRNESGIASFYWVGILENGQIIHKNELKDSHSFVDIYFDWKLSGFTEKVFQWSVKEFLPYGIEADWFTETGTLKQLYTSGYLFPTLRLPKPKSF